MKDEIIKYSDYLLNEQLIYNYSFEEEHNKNDTDRMLVNNLNDNLNFKVYVYNENDINEPHFHYITTNYNVKIDAITLKTLNFEPHNNRFKKFNFEKSLDKKELFIWLKKKGRLIKNINNHQTVILMWNMLNDENYDYENI
jgi:hypothetical protein